MVHQISAYISIYIYMYTYDIYIHVYIYIHIYTNKFGLDLTETVGKTHTILSIINIFTL